MCYEFIWKFLGIFLRMKEFDSNRYVHVSVYKTDAPLCRQSALQAISLLNKLKFRESATYIDYRYIAKTQKKNNVNKPL